MTIPGETREPEDGFESVVLAGRNGTATMKEGVLAFAEAAILVPFTTTPDGPMRLVLTGRTGKPLLAVFTAMDWMAPFAERITSARTTSGRSVLDQVPPEVGIVVNPGSDLGVEFAAEDIPRLREILPALPAGPGPNLPVERSILDARRGSLGHENVLAQLAAASLYMLSDAPVGNFLNETKPLVVSYNDRQLVALFTRPEYSRPFSAGAESLLYVELVGVARTLAANSGIVVNPGLDWAYLLSPDDVARLRAAGPDPRTG